MQTAHLSLAARLGLVLGASFLLQVLLVGVTDGSFPDLTALAGTNAVLHDDPVHVYAAVNAQADLDRFGHPYPPGYFPFIYAAGELAAVTGLAFERVVRLPEVLATLGIAALVQWELGRRGASAKARVTGAAMIALSPAFITFSAMHGQLDPMQWLFAIAGLTAWFRLPPGRRAVGAGLLLGFGIAIKTTPAFALLALLAYADDNRERAVLAGVAGGLNLLLLAPFLLADGGTALNWLGYAGLPGQGGLSLIVQPSLALNRYAGEATSGASGLQDLVQDAALPALLAVTAVTMVVIARRRIEPFAGSALMVLGVFVAGMNFLTPYVTWLIPFLVVAGWTRLYWALHVVVAIPLLVRYLPSSAGESLGISDGRFYDEWLIAGLYIPCMIVLWALSAWALVTRWRAPA